MAGGRRLEVEIVQDRAARSTARILVDAVNQLSTSAPAAACTTSPPGVAGGAASLPSSEFRSFGQIAGSAIATVVTWFTQLVAIVARVTSGIIAGFRSMMACIRPAFEVVGEALGDLRTAWQTLIGTTNDSTSATGESTSAWRSLGEFLGQVFGGVVTVITLALGGPASRAPRCSSGRSRAGARGACRRTTRIRVGGTPTSACS